MKTIYLLILLIPFSIFCQNPRLGYAIEQLNGQELINKGYSGKGIKIGIIDGGFLNADKTKSLAHLFENKQIKGYKDYATPDLKPYGGSKVLDDIHGTEVLTLVAGNNKERNVQFGLATDAEFYLARTDHGGYEKRKEEKDAVNALIWMAENGVRIVNMSIGYNYGFNNPKENYKTTQMDGKSTILTRAVDSLSKKYNMLVVVAAGNDGNVKKWKIINSPADAKEALSVGSTKLKVWDNMNYSSVGSPYIDFVKPEVSCFSSDGTSFSTPVITGFAAALLSANPSLSAKELKEIIIQSAHLSCCPNNYIGYGVPDAKKALNLVLGEKNKQSNFKKTSTRKNSYKVKIKEKPLYIAVFHKKSNNRVIEKQLIHQFNTKMKIHRKQQADKSTVMIGNHRVIEIDWLD